MAVVAGFEPAHPELTARTDTLPDIPQLKLARMVGSAPTNLSAPD